MKDRALTGLACPKLYPLKAYPREALPPPGRTLDLQSSHPPGSKCSVPEPVRDIALLAPQKGKVNRSPAFRKQRKVPNVSSVSHLYFYQTRN
ncbi:rCG55419 [Rattus norvegicus]|uniref:RCG55419 n=1 Tax=Rattus norvegicus TaxID=10116 RepID=A6JR84_RAT|nr:rCG55419 [Rattus norvegicus]